MIEPENCHSHMGGDDEKFCRASVMLLWEEVLNIMLKYFPTYASLDCSLQVAVSAYREPKGLASCAIHTYMDNFTLLPKQLHNII